MPAPLFGSIGIVLLLMLATGHLLLPLLCADHLLVETFASFFWPVSWDPDVRES